MNNKIKFKKYQCGGNDFVLFDLREGENESIGKLLDFPDRIQGITHRQFGIGADGILVLDNPKNPFHHVRLQYFNADGSLASLCGNGLMCTVLECGMIPKDSVTYVECDNGIYKSFLLDGHVTIEFACVEDLGREIPREILDCHAIFQEMFFVNTGVEHLCVELKNKEELDSLDVAYWGNFLCQHAFFFPKKTNVNFFTVESDKIWIRTFERGVYAETLSCGTGIMATSIFACVKQRNKDANLCEFTGNVFSKGGEYQSVIHWDQSSKQPHSLRLKGTPKFVFQGDFIPTIPKSFSN